jgi:hypothetical protein
VTIEDIVRKIVREEIDRINSAPARPVPRYEAPQQTLGCPRGCPPFTACGNSDCPLLTRHAAPFAAAGYEVVVDPSLNEGGMRFDQTPWGKAWRKQIDEMNADLKRRADAAPPQRTGCTCPPGAQTSCPDATCPWKPR